MSKTDTPILPTEFTVGDRTYELVPFLKEGKGDVSSDTMVARAKEMGADLGEEDGTFILEHQDEIPREYQGKFWLVFTAWRLPSSPRNIACLRWYDCRWYQYWGWLGINWGKRVRLVRRRPTTTPA